MAVADMTRCVDIREPLRLQTGPRWASIEQFRKGGARQLEEQLGPGKIGWLRSKGKDYVVVAYPTWDEVYGRAKEVNRLEGALVLIRQAIKLVFTSKKEGERLAIEHLSALVFQMPDLAVEGSRSSELVFDDGDQSAADELDLDTLELDPRKVRRPGTSRK